MKNNLKKLSLSAMFMAIGFILPMITGQIPQIGSMLLPMHIPVLLCGLICGWQYGLVVGLVLPILRSLTFGMPPLFSTAIAMMFELGTYGAVIGFFYNRSKWKCTVSLFRSMIIAMISGRVVWGVAMYILMNIRGGSFTLQAFLSGAIITAIPGIIIQFIFIPAIMVALGKAKLITFSASMKKPAKSQD